MKTIKPKAIMLAALSAMLLLGACAPTRNAEPSPSPRLQTAAPTGAPSESPTEAPTAEPTEEPTVEPTVEPGEPQRPGIPCAPVSELNEHDYNAVRNFLEIKDENGVRNGEKMNEYYDPDDPTTWFFWGSVFHEAEGNIPIAQFNENGRLLAFFIPFDQAGDKPGYRELTFYDIVGKLDLSGCEELISVTASWCGITALDVTGCNEPHLNIKQSKLQELQPKTINAFQLSVYFNELKQLHWVTVPNEHEEFYDPFGIPLYLNNFDFDLTVVAEGDGNVGIDNGFITDSSVEHNSVEIVADWDWENENIKFLGWYDKDGNLVTKEHLMCLPKDEETGLIQGTFYYVAKFETLNGD